MSRIGQPLFYKAYRSYPEKPDTFLGSNYVKNSEEKTAIILHFGISGKALFLKSQNEG